MAALALAAALLAVGAGAPAATAAPAASSTTTRQPTPPTPTRMGDYRASRFDAAAAQLPAGLATAVERDLGTTPQQYLSDSAAAADATGVVTHLRDRGVHVTDARMHGTTLQLRVASAADVAAARATGAEVTVGAKPPSLPLTRHFTPANRVAGGGTAWGYSTGASSYRCSVGFNGYGPGKRTDFVTAGHCVAGYSGTVQGITQAQADDPAAYFDQPMGSVAGVSQYGNGVDSARINVTNSAYQSPAAVSTWGGGQGSPDASMIPVRGDATELKGAPICKSGSTSGWTCGTILEDEQPVLIGTQTVNAFITDACVQPGDSGGAAMSGDLALGITSGTAPGACGAGQESAFFPVRSTSSPDSVEAVQSDWELGVSVSTPTVSTPSVVFAGGTFVGQVSGANAETTVAVYWDGATTPSATTNPDGSGAWSLPLPAPGVHSYRIVATWGADSSSAPVTGSVQVVPKPTTSRIAGSDRFDSSVQMSRAAFPGTAPHVPYVVVADGVSFPDALGAAPAAVKLGGPLLLTAPGYLPASVQAEIQRLAPGRIVVVGGPNAVSDDVETALAAIAPTQRVYGGDRYATAQAVAAFAFPSSVSTVYLVSGGNFPDALSAGAAASHARGPVLLVPGGGGADPATLAAIDRLHPAAIKVVGGTAVISDSYVQSLSGHGTVTRLSGADRWATAQAVDGDAFTSASRVELASGVAFPDALAGSALAGTRGDPLSISLPGCIPASVASEIGRLGAANLTILGGTAALGPAIDDLTLC